MPDKSTIIASICEINPSASPDWLSRFSAEDLREYLNHLMVAMEPAKVARWIRRNDRSPIVTREAA